MTKHGDVYLRTLLIHGARAVLRMTPKRSDAKSRWVGKPSPSSPRQCHGGRSRGEDGAHQLGTAGAWQDYQIAI
jgi:hypothetical protein